MTMYGGLFLDDLGSYKQCRDLGYADYGFIKANITNVNLFFYLGACLPQVCTQQDFQIISDHISSSLSGVLGIILPKNETKGALLHPYT